MESLLGYRVAKELYIYSGFIPYSLDINSNQCLTSLSVSSTEAGRKTLVEGEDEKVYFKRGY